MQNITKKSNNVHFHNCFAYIIEELSEVHLSYDEYTMLKFNESESYGNEENS